MEIREQLRFVFVGDQSVLVSCAEHALQLGHRVSAIATADARIAAWANSQAIPVFDADDALHAAVGLAPYDVLWSVANLRVLPHEILASALRCAVNFHDGPLPGYAGRNVTSWTILAGEREHAITWHVMAEKVDRGGVLLEQRFPIAPDETAFSLNARCYEEAIRTFPLALENVVDGSFASASPASGEKGFYGRYRRPGGLAVVDPQSPASDIARVVRALDLGGRIENPLGVMRLVHGGSAVIVTSAVAEFAGQGPAGPGSASRRVGEVISISVDSLRLQTVLGEIAITGAASLLGSPITPAAAAHALGLEPGVVLSLPDGLTDALDAVDGALAREEATWDRRMADHEELVLPGSPDEDWQSISVVVPPDVQRIEVLAAAAAWARRFSGRAALDIAVVDDSTTRVFAALDPLMSVAFARFSFGSSTTFADIQAQAAAELDIVAKGPYLADLSARRPARREHAAVNHSLAVLFGEPGPADSSTPHVLRLRVGRDGLVMLDHRLGAAGARQAGWFAAQLSTLFGLARTAPDHLVEFGDPRSAGELELMAEINATSVPVDLNRSVAELFRTQVAATPEAAAVSSGSLTLSYRALAGEVDRLANVLRAADIHRGHLVGIALPRGIDLLISVLAVHAVGAAYVPLDPEYPRDRLAFMAEDAGLAAVLTDAGLADGIVHASVPRIAPRTSVAPVVGGPQHRAMADDLAYVIYTSGSTGKPKGVQLEHRHVVNFFAGMDQVIDPVAGPNTPPGTWLAVTSLSFDISVLELLWTLTRGFHVVLLPDRDAPGSVPQPQAFATTVPLEPVPVVAHPAATGTLARPVSMSLFYFSADESVVRGRDAYRLLLEGARFADEQGFEAIWTPERHFHAFGGQYPNPSVTSAAIATITSRVAIRAGSCVLPLHNVARVAEEWAVVDNLSNGRVAISVAAGWQPNDFVLNPGAYANAKSAMFDGIEQLRALWRGEAIELEGPKGPVAIRTLPRPVQEELPIWVTSAGTPDTFRKAGTAGCNILTHLLGQSVEELAGNLAIYRAARRDAGHVDEGRVTLMLHTFVGSDAAIGSDGAAVRDIVRGPMKQYLSTATGLIRNMASAFPTFSNTGADADELFASLSDDEMDGLLEMAFERYYETSGLFGTADSTFEMIARCAAAGVDEVACLIDFGVPVQDVLDSFERLAVLHDTVRNAPIAEAQAQVPFVPPAGATLATTDVPTTVGGLIAHHGVTHLQCTPSQAVMLAADPTDRSGLATLRHLLLGGEALPKVLLEDLRSVVPGRITNMYGPTETTIWSLVHELPEVPKGAVPIGRPIANTVVEILDAQRRPVSIGVFGELCIGGDGVARGYLNRPELTAERFFSLQLDGVAHRLYATGDVARITPEGIVEFAGRSDHQVKIRGHRIELGEIETVLASDDSVRAAVVLAREDVPGDVRIVAYVTPAGGVAPDVELLRKRCDVAMPDFMVPAAIVVLPSLPQTPNGKIDRKALPAPTVQVDVAAVEARSEGASELLVATTWAEVLGQPAGRDDNFFDIGGHSLVAVQVFRRLTQETGLSLALTDVFRYPTIRTFAAHLDRLRDVASGADPGRTTEAEPSAGASRGAARRAAMLARRG